MSNNNQTVEKTNQKAAKSGKSVVRTTLSVFGIILCIFLALLLVCNIVIIVKGSSDAKKPPSVFGVTPMIVLSQSMAEENASEEDKPQHIEIDDLIFIDDTKPEDIQIGDVISYMEGSIVVTHKVYDIKEVEGGREFTTYGINNRNEEGPVLDTVPVKSDNLIGKYMFRVPYVGAVVYFMQKPLGMICFIGIPLLAFIIYDILRRQRAATKENKKTNELEAELARLRALAGEGSANDKAEEAKEEETPAEAPAETPAE